MNDSDVVYTVMLESVRHEVSVSTTTQYNVG